MAANGQSAGKTCELHEGISMKKDKNSKLVPIQVHIEDTSSVPGMRIPMVGCVLLSGRIPFAQLRQIALASRLRPPLKQ
ncbi:MAG: hypothetical protein UY03_C0044G0002 [Parcubacteria group bacterium GW2011_GWA2_47_64]|nr:MAG: hypothetical protein UY03_C0044G0002 [Parcubacteria group bacterium GW2011_GWA2_47_64]